MEGNIIFVDYELSSWKYQNHSKSSKYAKYLTGQLSPVKSRAILIKRGYVFPQQEEKGMGSAYGGEWKPKKPDDERFIDVYKRQRKRFPVLREIRSTAFIIRAISKSTASV